MAYGYSALLEKDHNMRRVYFFDIEHANLGVLRVN